MASEDLECTSYMEYIYGALHKKILLNKAPSTFIGIGAAMIFSKITFLCSSHIYQHYESTMTKNMSFGKTIPLKKNATVNIYNAKHISASHPSAYNIFPVK